MSDHDPTTEPVDKLMTVDETAEYLRIGRAKLYRLMRAGEIEWKTVGTRRRIPMSAIEAYLASTAA